jgi:hypothetical protein
VDSRKDLEALLLSTEEDNDSDDKNEIAEIEKI